MTAGRFELHGTMTIDDVPDVRRFVEKVHRRLVPSLEDVSRVAMAAHELLENAVKYSADGTASLRIEVDGSEIRITTRNAARREDLAGLIALANELEQAGDPMAFYVGLMARSPSTRGGLGLGRVAAEADMQIGIALHGDIVEVRACSQLTQTVVR